MAAVLLNHFNGTDGETSFTDEVSGVSWSQVAGTNAEKDTAITKWGTASIRMLTGSRVRASGVSSPHAGDLTVQGWVYSVGQTSADGPSIAIFDASFNLSIQLVFFGQNNLIQWDVYKSDSSSITSGNVAAAMSNATWYHFAVVRDSVAGTWALFFNGVRIKLVTDSSASNELEVHDILAATNDVWHFDDVNIRDSAEYSGSTYTIPDGPFELQDQINIVSPTFDFEAAPAVLSKNLLPNSAEFDFEAQAAGPSTNIVAQSAEFDYELRSAGIQQGVIADNPEFEFEAGSPALTQSNVVTPGSSEYDYEAGPETFAIGVAPEFGYEAGSPGLGQTHNVGVVSAEFGYESSFRRLLYFRPYGTPERRRLNVTQPRRVITIEA